MTNWERVFAHAQHLIRQLPAGTPWMFSITDQDGDGEDPTYPSLSITSPPEPHLTQIIDALGGGFEQPGIEGLLVKVDRGLEVSVEERV